MPNVFVLSGEGSHAAISAAQSGGISVKINPRILGAEALGTAVLMLGGPGTAILMAPSESKLLAVSLAFGFSLLIMAYVIGPISGCHINPAVSFGLWVSRKISGAHALAAVIGQLIGAWLGGLIIWGIVKASNSNFGGEGFASNGYGAHSPAGYKLGSAAIAEIVFTALLVIVVLFTTTKKFSVGMGGLVAGITLALIHLISIPIDNTSVNPARSFGAAIFAAPSNEALKQLWAFVVFPLVGAAVGAAVFMLLNSAKAEAAEA